MEEEALPVSLSACLPVCLSAFFHCPFQLILVDREKKGHLQMKIRSFDPVWPQTDGLPFEESADPTLAEPLQLFLVVKGEDLLERAPAHADRYCKE